MALFSEQFVKGHILTEIDARIKIFVSLILLAMLLSYQGFALPLIVMSICLSLCVVMGIPLKVLALRFSEPLLFAIVILLLKCFFSTGAHFFYFTLFGIEIGGHKDGLMEGLTIVSRIIGCVSIVIALGFSTPFAEFMAGLAWFKVPRSFIEILMFAYRYIFVLFEDAQVIFTAQKNRLGYSSMRRGLRSIGTLAGSLTIRAFDHSHNTTVAMVQRGYDGTIPILRHQPFKARDLLLSALFLLVMGAIWKI